MDRLAQDIERIITYRGARMPKPICKDTARIFRQQGWVNLDEVCENCQCRLQHRPGCQCCNDE